MEVNEEKRNKFMEYAGKRVNNVMHDIQILEPMAVEKKVFSFGTTKVTETTNNQLDGTEECQEPEVGFEEI